MVIKILKASIFFFLSGCFSAKTQKLTYPETFFLRDSKIRTDGFYLFEDTCKNCTPPYLADIIVFFKNGYLFQERYLSIEAAKSAISKGDLKKNKFAWGGYKIDENKIYIQYFIPYGNNFTTNWDVLERQGIVKNSFEISLNEKIYKNESKIEKKLYHFKETNINSDGINWLIEGNQN